MHHYHMPHCPYLCPCCQGHYAPPYPFYRRGRCGEGRGAEYERDAIRDRIEALKDELKAMEERLAQLEERK